jgi:peroxiredoxin
MAAATPHRALIEAAGLNVVEPARTAPAVALEDYQGNPITTQDQRGKVILMNFWATWCPPCIHEMPFMEQLFLSLQGRPFSLWALNVQETREDVAAFLQSRGFHFPVLLDAEGQAVRSYRVKGLPSTYLIDCAGKLIGSITGVLKWADSAMQALLETLFKEPACHATTASTTRIHPIPR